MSTCATTEMVNPDGELTVVNSSEVEQWIERGYKPAEAADPDAPPTRNLRSKAGVIEAITDDLGDRELGPILTGLGHAEDTDLQSLSLAQLKAVLEAVSTESEEE